MSRFTRRRTNESADDVNDRCGSHGGHIACVPLIRAAAPAAAAGSFQGEAEGLECGSRSSAGSVDNNGQI